MTSPCGTLERRRTLFGTRFRSIAFGLVVAIGGLGLTGCDKIQIPGVNAPAAAPPAPAPAPGAPVATGQAPAAAAPAPPPMTTEVVKPDGKAMVKSFLDKTKNLGSVEDRDLLSVVEAKEGLELVAKLDLPGAKVTDKGLAVLSKFPNLIAVNIAGSAVTDAGLNVFKDIPLLESLSLSGAKVGDVGLATIADHPSLKELHLSKTGITDKGLELLDKLPNLEVLDISYTGITGAGFNKFKGNKKLRVLYAQHTGILPGAFQFLKGAPIEDLNLDVTPTNDVAMMSISTMKKLKHLRLEFDAGVTDLGMSKMTGLKDLETLSVRNVTGLTYHSLVPLKTCKKLKMLTIVGTLITESDAQAFQKMIGPGLRIERQ